MNGENSKLFHLQAMNGENSKLSHDAMMEEMESMAKNKVWDLFNYLLVIQL